jgi:hypothetical protein
MAHQSPIVIAAASPDRRYDTAAEAKAATAVPLRTAAAASSAVCPVFEAVQLRALAANAISTVHGIVIYHCRLDRVIRS